MAHFRKVSWEASWFVLLYPHIFIHRFIGVVKARPHADIFYDSFQSKHVSNDFKIEKVCLTQSNLTISAVGRVFSITHMPWIVQRTRFHYRPSELNLREGCSMLKLHILFGLFCNKEIMVERDWVLQNHVLHYYEISTKQYALAHQQNPCISRQLLKKKKKHRKTEVTG